MVREGNNIHSIIPRERILICSAFVLPTGHNTDTSKCDSPSCSLGFRVLPTETRHTAINNYLHDPTNMRAGAAC
jgi:hypothetical protein